MIRKIMMMALVALLVVSAFGCVTKKTFELKEEEARQLEESLNGLQARYDQLDQEKKVLEAEKQELIKEKVALIDDNNKLDAILKAKSDTLSQTIAELRQNMVDQKNSYEAQIKDLDAKIAELVQESTGLRAELKARETNIMGLQNEVLTLKMEKDKQVTEMSKTYGELIEKMKGEIDKGQITISELKGKLTVNLVDAVLFDSGKAEIKKEGLDVLQKVVDILISVTDKAIRVEGHTDNVKISGGLAQKYPTNWELSAARAINVCRFLQEKGISPDILGAVAYGEFKPVADNETPEGRAQNRRIEIILVAKD